MRRLLKQLDDDVTYTRPVIEALAILRRIKIPAAFWERVDRPYTGKNLKKAVGPAYPRIPVKPTVNRKTSVSLDAATFARLCQWSQLYQLPKATWIRMRLAGTLPPVIDQENRVLNQHLHRLLGNLTQLKHQGIFPEQCTRLYLKTIHIRSYLISPNCKRSLTTPQAETKKNAHRLTIVVPVQKQFNGQLSGNVKRSVWEEGYASGPNIDDAVFTALAQPLRLINAYAYQANHGKLNFISIGPFNDVDLLFDKLLAGDYDR